MALESTPEIQESADTPMSLDAVLESSIGTSLDSVEETEEAPVENTAQASKEDLTVPAEKHTSPETQVEDSEDLDQLATEYRSR
jgi:hypothetical protein